MCALVTGVQTCALPIWDAYAGVDGWIAGCRLAGLVAAPACVVRGHEQHRVLQDRQRVPAKRDRPVRHRVAGQDAALDWHDRAVGNDDLDRSEEHTSELQSLMRISYAVFCLKKKTHQLYSTN